MKKLQHKFVEYMPRQLEDGILYVSIRFRIVSHKCPCGCGNEVVTNLSPKGWQLTFDGESISLYPSIGNWDFKCRSHYWITRNTVRWSGRWSEAKIQKARDFENLPQTPESVNDSDPQSTGKTEGILRDKRESRTLSPRAAFGQNSYVGDARWLKHKYGY